MDAFTIRAKSSTGLEYNTAACVDHEEVLGIMSCNFLDENLQAPGKLQRHFLKKKESLN